VRQITASFAGADFDPTPTPDGKHIVFASTQHRPTADIYIKPVHSAVVTRLTDDPGQDVMPAVSPDGRYIAFCSDRNGSWDIFVMPIEGGKAVQLTSDTAHDLHPSWSPEGNRIVFSRLGQQTGRWEMWVADVRAVNSAQFIGFGLFPQWAPVAGTGAHGADQIMFQRSRERGDRAFSVWTIDYQANPGTAGRETEIATSPGSALINPSWSPDGRFVTFAQVPYSEAWASGASARPESSVLWMMSVDGTGKVKLTDGKSIDLMPTWSRNNEIFFVSNMGGSEHLWSMELSPALRAASVQIRDLDSAFVNAPTNP
jgi:TolB protein